MFQRKLDQIITAVLWNAVPNRSWPWRVIRQGIKPSLEITIIPPVERGGWDADLGQGATGLVIDSSGLLCLAVDRSSAAKELSLGEGEQVSLQPGATEPGVSTPISLRNK